MKIKKLLKIFFIIIVIFVLLIIGIRCYFRINFKNSIVEFEEYGVLIENSNDMEPEIYKNELIIIKNLKEYDLDDIVAYVNFNNNLLIRRIVQIDEYGFISRADNNSFVEPDEEIDRIKGKVVYHSKILGKIFNW